MLTTDEKNRLSNLLRREYNETKDHVEELQNNGEHVAAKEYYSELDGLLALNEKVVKL